MIVTIKPVKYYQKNKSKLKFLSPMIIFMVVMLINLGNFIFAMSVQAQSFSFIEDEKEIKKIEKIKRIIISGNKRVEKQTVLEYLDFKKNDVYLPEKADLNIKKLFNSGLFNDIKINFKQGVLRVIVQENAIVNFITVEGNIRLNDKKIIDAINLKPGSIFTKNKVQNDVQSIKSLYTGTSRFAVKVEPKIIKRNFNRVDLIFEVDEGPSTKIQSINFIGNEAFSDKELRSQIASKQSRWWRILTSADNYDPGRLEYDTELIRQFYNNSGYPKAKIVSVTAGTRSSNDGFYITFTINEGKEYFFDKIDYENSIVGLSINNIDNIVKGYRGNKYSSEEIDKIVEKIALETAEQGYAFTDIRRQIKLNEKKQIVHVRLVIQATQRVYVERIEIIGNVRTEDRVIRREFAIAEGDPFSQSAITEAERRLKNLDFFRQIKVYLKRGSSTDRIIIMVEVIEKSTGALKIGAGYSSVEKLVGEFAVTERNLLGKGQYIDLSLSLSKIRRDAIISFVEPYLFGERLALGLTLFNTRKDNSLVSSFKYRATGGSISIGTEIAQYTNLKLIYGFSSETIYDVKENAPISIINAQGKYNKSEIGHELRYSTIDHPYLPSRGFIGIFGQSYAGVGGNVKYLKNELKVANFFNLGGDFVFSLRGKTGIISGIGGQDVRIIDNFYLGDSDMRGFDYGGVGPRHVESGAYIGGKKYFVTTASLAYGLSDTLGLQVDIFTDIGTVFDSDVSKTDNTYDDKSVRVSVGFGFSINSPFGPLRLDFAEVIRKRSYDRTAFFRFGIATLF